MTADHRMLRLLMSVAALSMSTGCQAVTTIFETGVWVGVILVVVVLAAVAFVVRKFRGGGGPPRGTMAATGGLLLLGTALTAAPHPETQSPSAPAIEQGRPEDRERGDKALEEVLLQGCVARDDGWRPEERPGTDAATSSADDRGEMFVLRDARRVGPGPVEPTAERPGDREATYRLLPRSGVSLSTFEGQQIEVRGRLRVANESDTATSAIDHRNSQAVQGGQMQAVGQTMSAGQGGQSGQSTAAPEQARPQAGAEGTGETYSTVIVTSVRMLSPTCTVHHQ